MIILGLTGGIATGKSTVAAMLAEKGAIIIDADQLSREVVAPGSATLIAVNTLFPSPVLLPDGTLNRTAVREQIFADPALRKKLEAIVHPAIAERAQQLLEKARLQKAGVVVYMAPLLFETAADTRVGTDQNWVVTTTPAIQHARLLQRDNCTPEQARQILDAQMPIEQKIARADLVIDNSGTREETLQQVDTAWEQRIAPHVR